MRQFRHIALATAIALSVAACDDTGDADRLATEKAQSASDQATVDKEVQTPMQKTYDSADECKKEFSTDGDCIQKTIIVNNQPVMMWYSPFFYPWGAIYHPGGFYSYGHVVPIVSSRVVTTSLPASAPRPNYSHPSATTYSSARTSSMTASRGGFGGTARGASSSSSSASRSGSSGGSYGGSSGSRGGSSGGSSGGG